MTPPPHPVGTPCAIIQVNQRSVQQLWCHAGTLVDHVLIQQRQKGSAAHTVVLDSEQPGGLRCELEILQEQQVSRRST